MAVILCMAITVNAKNFFKEGTHWIVEVYPDWDPTADTFFSEYFIDDTEIIDGKEYMKMFEKHESGKIEFLYLLRSEGEKVYMRNAYNNTDYLIYNFGLKPGEYCTIYQSFGLETENKRTPIEWNLTYSDVQFDPVWGENKLSLEGTRVDNNNIPLDKAFWIDGIGSSVQPGINLISGIDGYGSRVIEVIVDGMTIFKANNTSISEIQENESLHDNEIYYRIDGTFSNAPTKGINITNGKKILY